MFFFTRRKIILLLFPLSLLIVLSALVHFETVPKHHVEAVKEGFKSMTGGFELNSLYSLSDGDENELPDSPDLGVLGYQLEQGNVKFKYIKGDTPNTPEEVLEENVKLYSKIMEKEINEPKDFDMESIRPPAEEDLDSYQRAPATIISLARNQEALKIAGTIRKFEKQFNSKFRYPYTFINDQPFTDSFKNRMRRLSQAEMEFVTVPPEVWDKPDWIDSAREEAAMEVMFEHNVAYAKLASYHNMCRFYLGNFFKLPELEKYRYYWRIEPDVGFYNELKYDIFKYMEGTQKKYGFNINLYDITESVASLWPETLNFLNKDDNYKYVNQNGAFQWLVYPEQHPNNIEATGGYLACHFWSNFEIADMDFFRGEAYTKFFEYLDSTGKFYYERWGDAPVHSIGVALFADFKKDVHWFRDISYLHDPYFHCPKSPLVHGCEAGKFSRYGNLNDQNCMATWLSQFEEGELDQVY